MIETNRFGHRLQLARFAAERQPGFPGIPVPLGGAQDDILETLEHLQQQHYFNKHPSHLLLKMNRSYITLNGSNVEGLLHKVKRTMLQEEQDEYKEEFVEALLHGNPQLELRVVMPKQPQRRLVAGSFFKYLNMSPWIDLSRYGIYSRLIDISLQRHCLVNALAQTDLFTEEQLDSVSLLVDFRPFPRTRLAKVAELLGVRIRLTTWTLHNRKVQNIPRNGDEEYPLVSLGLFESHYFINEMTPYTSSDVLTWMRMPAHPHQLRALTSSQLVQQLYHQNAFTPLELSQAVFERALDRHLAAVDISFVDHSEMCIKPVESTSKNHREEAVVFFDIETDTQTEDHHIPYAVSWWNTKHEKPSFLMIENRHDVDQLGRAFLTRVYDEMESVYHRKSIILIAHNAGYDLQILLQCCHPLSVLKDGNRLKTWHGVFYPRYIGSRKMDIYLLDSYLMIPQKLEDFGKIFRLPMVKQWYPYNDYTIERICTQKTLPLPNPADMVDYEDWIAEGELQGWVLNENGQQVLGLREYAEFYCVRDVVVLRSGYLQFRDWMMEITRLDILHHISLSHLAKNYMFTQGCFDNVYAMTQQVMLFMRQSVIGGRTMVCRNTPMVIEGKIEDQDVNSLYPTAMMRMPGFLQGAAKRIPEYCRGCEGSSFMQYCVGWDGYIVKIYISDVGIARDFPLMCYKDKQGCLVWTNEMVHREMTVCKTSLEDIVQYHDIHFKVVDGYYFDEGFNMKIRELVSTVYERRMVHKRSGNPIQQAYKLLLNSFYGVTLTRPPNVEHKFCQMENRDIYYARHHPWIEKMTECGMQYYPEEHKQEGNDVQYVEFQLAKTLKCVSNLPHIGGEILAWSKRHMNEIIYLAEDYQIPIYYTDTDSLHLREQDHEYLGNVYEEKYDRPLYGQALGQLSSEWSEGIYSFKGYFLGKKMYCDWLSDDTLHYCMKGVTKQAVLAVCHRRGWNVPELYQALYEGESIQFHNGENADGSLKVTFQRQDNGIYKAMEEKFLKRRIKLY